MSVLSILEATPNRVRALVRLAAHLGPVPRAVLHANMMPARPDASAQFNNLMRETLRLALLAEKDGKVILGEGIDRRDVEKDEWFLSYIDRRLVRPTIESDDNNVFAFALAWFLEQPAGNPLQWTSDQHLIMTSQLVGENVYDLTNADRFAMLCYWSRFLGFVTRSDIGGTPIAIPDPTEAIDRRLDRAFANERRLPIGAFLTELAGECTVLEGGTVRKEIRQRQQTKRLPNELSSATSLALWRLEKRRRIRLGLDSDAEAWQMLTSTGGSGTGIVRRITHIEFIG